MKIKLKATNLSVGFIFVLTVLSGIASAETLVFEDNFDSYGSDTFPSSGGWHLKYNGYGTAYQIVDSSQSHSFPNSLKLEARYNWASAADHSLSETPEQLTYEVDVKIGEPDSIEDEGRANAQISIVDPDIDWGKSYGLVVFGVNGLVGDSPYNYNQWYHVKINLDMEKRTFDAWINDKQIVTNSPVPADGYYKAVRLCAENAGHTRVWFDNVKVTQGDSSPSDETQKVQFRGNLEKIVYTYSQNTAYVINVKEIIFDPGNSINIGDSVQVWYPYSKSSASVDIVKAGDYVEVRATGLKLINFDDFLKKQN